MFFIVFLIFWGAKISPKPIENSALINEIIANIIEKKNKYRKKSLEFLIYNTLPGTTEAALSKSYFLKDIILEKIKIDEINQSFAFDLLSHMKGGPSVKVLIDLALGNSSTIIKKAANILKKQVMNQFILNMNKPTGLSPLELREKLLKIKNQIK